MFLAGVDERDVIQLLGNLSLRLPQIDRLTEWSPRIRRGPADDLAGQIQRVHGKIRIQMSIERHRKLAGHAVKNRNGFSDIAIPRGLGRREILVAIDLLDTIGRDPREKAELPLASLHRAVQI